MRKLLLFAGVTCIIATSSLRPTYAQVPDEHMVPMRDGVRLATDVYRLLFDNDEHPVILIRTPYGKDDIDSLLAPPITLLLINDYVVVIQDTRGAGASEGVNDVFQSAGWGEKQDGYDTIEWVAAQSWCDGNVGMFGASALGINAYLAAGAQPPALKCCVVAFSAGDLYAEAAYQGGELRAALVDGWVGDQNPDMISVLVSHPSRDAYWSVGDAESRVGLINVPMLHVGGWYDCFEQGTLDMFTGLQNGGAPAALGDQRLIMGPWTHGNVIDNTQGELDYPSNSVFETTELVTDMLDYFDYWLHGDDNGAMDGPPVRYYMMGDVDDSSSQWNEWRDIETWPPPGTTERLYFAAGGALQAAEPSGSAALSETYSYDPANPVPTLGGANLEIDAGPYDQQTVEGRADMLVYTSALLTEPLEIAGPVTVELFASSSAVDTDWTAKLCDVYPDGRSMLVCDGVLRARYRESETNPELLQPGRWYRFEIDLWSTALAFNQGHRIRVAVSSSNSTRFEANENNAEPVRGGGTPVIAQNTVFHDPGRRSSILLPVIAPADHPLFADTTTDVRYWPLYP